MRRTLPVFAILLATALGCQTIGVSRRPGGFAEVKPTIAHELILDSQQVVVIDFRPVEEYWGALGHIGGALTVPLETIDKRLPELLPYRDTTILVYGDTDEESTRGARILAAAGLENVVRIEGGIRAWISYGYPVVTVE